MKKFQRRRHPRRHHRDRQAAVYCCQYELGFQETRDSIGRFGRRLRSGHIERAVRQSGVFGNLRALAERLVELSAPQEAIDDVVECRELLGQAIGQARAGRARQRDRKFALAYCVLSRAEGVMQCFVRQSAGTVHSRVVVLFITARAVDGGGDAPDRRSGRTADNGQRTHATGRHNGDGKRD